MKLCTLVFLFIAVVGVVVAYQAFPKIEQCAVKVYETVSCQNHKYTVTTKSGNDVKIQIVFNEKIIPAIDDKNDEFAKCFEEPVIPDKESKFLGVTLKSGRPTDCLLQITDDGFFTTIYKFKF